MDTSSSQPKQGNNVQRAKFSIGKITGVGFFAVLVIVNLLIWADIDLSSPPSDLPASNSEKSEPPDSEDEPDVLLAALRNQNGDLIAALKSIATDVEQNDDGQIVVLNLEYQKITDAGLRHLAKLKHLQVLNLSATRISDDGLVSLKGLSSLTTLKLYYSSITGSGLRHLESLPRLDTIVLYGSRLSDSGLKGIENLRSLKGLVLSTTAVGDSGLQHLHGLDGLVMLELKQTAVTKAGVNRLRAELPNCVIYAP